MLKCFAIHIREISDEVDWKEKPIQQRIVVVVAFAAATAAAAFGGCGGVHKSAFFIYSFMLEAESTPGP
jgi:hypothetical protein